MITRIVLENFMSHRHTVIEPAEGLTVLTGPNNCGKSAVVTALQTLCENERGSQMYVRHGEKLARVAVETSEGHTLEWKREGSTVSYRINGRDVHRLRGGVPEDLDELLRLKPVPAAEGTDPFQVHFSEQKQPIFLLNETPGRAATFFASASDTRLLLAMQRLAQERRKSRKKESEFYEKRITEGTDRLALFAPVDSIDKDVTAAEAMHQALLVGFDETRVLGELIAGADHMAVNLSRLEASRTRLEALSNPPVLGDSSPLNRSIADLAACRRRREIGEREAAVTMLLVAPVELVQTDVLARAVVELTRTQRGVSYSTAKVRATQGLSLPEPLAPLEDLSRTIRLLTALVAQTESVSSADAKLRSITAPPEAISTDGLARAVHDLAQAQSSLDRANVAASSASGDLERSMSDLRSYIAKHPECPLCGGIMTADQVFTGGHTHG